MSYSTDLERLKTEYAARRERLADSDKYSLFNPAALFSAQQLERWVLKTLRSEGFFPLSNYSVLDLGCGSGGVLLDYLSYGIKHQNLYGLDLLSHRVQDAKVRLPHLGLICADGQSLPYADNSFDIILQYTVFSSILDQKIKQNIAKEMKRVLQPGGLILWYDFWLNPINKQTRGIRPAEIRDLFPGCRIKFHRITLAPPIARRLVPVSWIIASIVERFGFLNTHYLAAVRPT